MTGDAPTAKQVRDWARAAGLDVGTRGRLSPRLFAEYQAAHPPDSPVLRAGGAAAAGPSPASVVPAGRRSSAGSSGCGGHGTVVRASPAPGRRGTRTLPAPAVAQPRR
jgi:hypothetical protein